MGWDEGLGWGIGVLVFLRCFWSIVALRLLVIGLWVMICLFGASIVIFCMEDYFGAFWNLVLVFGLELRVWVYF